MRHVWQYQEAKNKFSRVVKEALTNGPQLITKQDSEGVVVLSYAEYRKMMLKQTPLSVFFQESPLVEDELDITRDSSDLRPDLIL